MVAYAKTPTFTPNMSRIMLRSLLVLLYLTLSLSVGLNQPPASNRQSTSLQQNPGKLLRQGDTAWNNGSYELALSNYQKALAADPHLLTQSRRAEIDYRIAVALGKTKQWDQAVAAIESFVKTYHDTLQEARGQMWRARLYYEIDHNAYRLYRTIKREFDPPPTDVRYQPYYFSLKEEDERRCTEALFRAKALLDRFRGTRLAIAERADLTRQEIDLNFDLAKRITDDSVLNVAKWIRDAAVANVNRASLSPFDPKEPAPKQIVSLYNQIPLLDASLPTTDHHATVLAALGKATYIVNLRKQIKTIYTQTEWSYDFAAKRGIKSHPPVRLNVPYAATDPIAILQNILKRYPQDPQADQLVYTVALWTEQKGDLVEAVDRYRDFSKKYPRSSWVGDAASRLHALTSPSFWIKPTNFTLPGVRAKVQMTSRNLKQVRFTAYRVHLEDIYGKTSYHSKRTALDPEVICHPRFTDYRENFGKDNGIGGVTREKAAAWIAVTSDTGRHKEVVDTTTVPVDAPGAYLVEGVAGNRDEFKYEVLIIISDIVVVQKLDRDALWVYTANAITGKPLPNVKLMVWYSSQRGFDRDLNMQARYITAATDGNGLCRLNLPDETTSKRDTSVQRNTAVFACAGTDRYAVTPNERYFAAHAYDSIHTAYIYTDLPFYQIGSEVHLKAILTSGVGSTLQSEPDRQAYLTVKGPQAVLFSKQITFNADGVYTDSFRLPEKADLGDYQIHITSPDERDSTEFGSTSVGVESLKRTAFKVTVQPNAGQVRAGTPLSVTINAHDFSGNPIAQADVHYSVVCGATAEPPGFPAPLPWFNEQKEQMVAYNQSANYTLSNAGRTVYREGNLTTDSQGNARIVFPIDRLEEAYGDRFLGNQNFVITAIIRDVDQRHSIGRAMVQILTRPLSVFIRPDRKVCAPGEAVRLNLLAADMSGHPVRTSGELSVYRQIPALPDKLIALSPESSMTILKRPASNHEVLCAHFQASTGAEREDTTSIVWTPDSPGAYRIEYKTRDAWGNTVTAQCVILVYGSGLDKQISSESQWFGIYPDRSSYRPGDTARFLIISSVPDSTILFTEQNNNKILRSRPVTLSGRSAVIEVKIGEEHAPNTHFIATRVVNGKVQEVFSDSVVPLTSRVLSISVATDRKEYRPGDKAVVHIHATAADGKPVRSEISLSVADEWLYDIESGNDPSISNFFYGLFDGLNSNMAWSTYSDTDYKYGPNSTNFKSMNMSVPKYQDNYKSLTLLTLPPNMGWLNEKRDNQNQPLTIPDFVAYPNVPQHGVTNSSLPFDAEGMRRARSIGEIDDSSLIHFSLHDPLEVDENMLPINRPEFTRAYDGPSTPDNSKGGLAGRAPYFSAACWMSAVETDADGNATVTFTFPQYATQPYAKRWRITAIGITKNVEVGTTKSWVITK